MKKTKILQSIFVCILCFVLITAMALLSVGCKTNDNTDVNNSSSPISSSGTSLEENTPTVLGEGKLSFDFSVTHKDGKIKHFVINTDKEKVGEALSELGLIEGEEGQFGLYVKTVNGETLDFNKDKLYWAFYEDGKYAGEGVDKTEIKSGVKYEFKASK